jgi:hypothetical protein
MNKIQLYIAAGAIGFGVLTSSYFLWKRSIEREALLEYNRVQIEQNIKDKEELHRKIQIIDQKQREIDEANAADKKAFNDKIDSLDATLSSKDVVNRPASKVLKDTINRLKDISQ